MNLLTRVKIYATLVALALVVGAAALYDEWGRPNPQADTTENVTVHAHWFRSRGTQPIEVKVFTEGVQIWEDSLVTSPWSKIFIVPRGALVVARFDQPTGGQLQCRIDRPTRLGSPKSRETAGPLTCEG